MISLAHPYIMGAAQGVQTSLRVIVGFVMRNIERPPVWYSLFKIYHRGLKTGILLLDYCRVCKHALVLQGHLQKITFPRISW